MFILLLMLNIYYLSIFVTFQFFTQFIIKSYIQLTAEKLDNKLLSMLADLKYLQSKENKYYFCVHKEEYHATKACFVTHVYFYCFKKVYKQVCLKELCLVK